MARYGQGAEDFNRETAALERAMAARKGVAAAEAQLTGALDSSSSALERAAAKTRLYRQAKQEADEFAQRSVKVEAESARGIDLETEAIRRNTAARERSNAAARAGGGAVAGARDPLFGRAAGLADPTTGVSQYELRRQLGIGSARAARLQEAIGAGFRPGGPGVAHGPITGTQDADLAYKRAMDARRAALKKGDEAALIAADAELASAKARRSELESIAKESAARSENAAAIQADAAARRRAGGGGPGTALIRHPELYGRQAYAPISQPAAVARTPVQEFPLRFGGGSQAYDDMTTRKAATAAEGERRLGQAQQQRAALAHLALEQDERLNQIYSTQSTSLDRVSRSYRQSAVEVGAASQQMTRHGALTSEFITAAFRGQTTIKELGNQALITAGKFGAWTLAATGVYGAVRALGSVGRGAIDAQSGVHQLTRVVNNVNPESASKAFGDLAGEFNVPIKDVSDAVYRMGQVFHDQTDAVTAAKAALYSYTTGEVDVATSTTNLIAIQRGFGLQATDLLKIYDQINQAQNTFGIKIGDTEAGLAKAGGTFKNAGGDLSYLLGLFVAISKATGRSGTEIGTGIARAANQIRKPKSQETLQALGVDVDPNNLQLTIQRAIGRARKPGADYNAIAAGVFGNQYARLFAPVLRDPSTLQDALVGTSQKASKDSAQIEFNKTKAQVDYQIRQLGVSMQRIGEALARSGAFDAAGGLLKALNAVLSTGVDLVNAFDKLPEPLRNSLAILGEIYVTMRLLRRFGIADTIGANLGFKGSQQRQEASLVNRGLTAGQQAARDSLERDTRRSLVAQAEAQSARRATGTAASSLETRLGTGSLVHGTEEHVRAQAAVIELDRKAQLAEARALELQLEANLAREEVVLFEKDIATMKKLEAEAGAGAVVAEAQRRGMYRPADHDSPSAHGAVPVGAYGYNNVTGERVPLGPIARDIEANAPLSRASRAVAPAAGALRTLAGESTTLVQRVNPLRIAATTAASGLERGAAAVTGSVGSLKKIGSGIANIARSLGPLDFALIGFLAYETISSKADEFDKHASEIEHRLESAPRSAAERKKQLATKPQDPNAPGTRAANLFENFGGLQTLQGEETPVERAQRQQDEYVQLQDEENRRLGLQNFQRTKGKYHPIPLQFLGEITKQMSDENKQRISGVISQKEFDKLLEKHAVEIKSAYNTGDKGALARATAELEDMKRQVAKPSAFGKRYDSLKLPDLQKELEGSATLAAEGTDVGLHFREMAYIYNRIRTLIGGQHTTAALTTLLAARKAFFQGVEQAVDTELQTALRNATNQGEKNAAYAHAQTQLKQLPAASRKELDRDKAARAKAKDNLAKAQKALGVVDGVPQLGDLGGGVGAGSHLPGIPRGPDHLVEDIKKSIRADKKRIRELDKQIKGDKGDIAAAEKERAQQSAKYRDDAYSSREAGRNLELAYQQSLTYDKGKADAEAINAAATQVQDAARTYGRGSDQWKQAMTNLNNARKNADNYIVANAQANNALITAHASGDPTGRSQAQAAITTAQNQYNADARDPKLAGQERVNKLKEDRAAIITAQLAYGQWLHQQAAALAEARFALQESRTTDPVKIARIELRAAADKVKRANTPQDKIQAQADYNQKKHALVAARVSAREDTIDFDLQMERITRDQAIAELQSLLKTHGLTKQMRRDILLKIKQLKKDAENDAQGFDLDIGNIKLPTIYDVRRALGTLKPAGDQGHRFQANNKIDVNVTVTDPKAAGAVYDALDQAMGTTISANMRQAGLTL